MITKKNLRSTFFGELRIGAKFMFAGEYLLKDIARKTTTNNLVFISPKGDL